MTIISITYEAKCKHCTNFERYKKGRQTRHRCKISQKPVDLKSKICKDNFKLN
jgi:hypothetical protein